MFELWQDKTNKLSVRPAKTQISLRIHPVWSESSLSAWRNLGSLATTWAHSEDSDQTGRMPRLIWVFAGHTLILLVLSCRGSFHIRLLLYDIVSVTLRFSHSFSTKCRKFPKYSDTQKICCNHSKNWTMWFYHRVISPNDADGMANSVDPDQTAPLRAVWSGSALFAQAYLSENLESLWCFGNNMLCIGILWLCTNKISITPMA